MLGENLLAGKMTETLTSKLVLGKITRKWGTIVGAWADAALRRRGTSSGVLSPPEGSRAVNRGQCPRQTRNSAPLQPADLSSETWAQASRAHVCGEGR